MNKNVLDYIFLESDEKILNSFTGKLSDTDGEVQNQQGILLVTNKRLIWMKQLHVYQLGFTVPIQNLVMFVLDDGWFKKLVIQDNTSTWRFSFKNLSEPTVLALKLQLDKERLTLSLQQVECRYCGKSMATTALYCPHCGANRKP